MTAFTNTSQVNVSSYVVKTPRTSTKKFTVMRFDASQGIDFKSWTQAKMQRENNAKQYRSIEDEAPKYGRGSEYRQIEKAEARRRRLGIQLKHYRQEDQPWILTLSGKKAKKYKGTRAGGISENSSWYIFTQGKDGSFEAYPVEEWYSFRPIDNYKSLTEEEAEKHFERRSKIRNYFPLMKKQTAGEDDEDDDSTVRNRGFLGNSLVLSEIHDWMSDSDSEDKLDEENQEDIGSKKKKKNKVQSKGRKQQGGKKQKKAEGESEDEACIEESDEYDDGAEHDYISSDSSDSEAEDDEVVRRELAGVDEADALRKLINSDEDDDEQQEGNESSDDAKDEKNKNKKKKRDKKSDKEVSGGIILGKGEAVGESRVRQNEIGFTGRQMSVPRNVNTKRRTKAEIVRGGGQGSPLDTAGPSMTANSRSENSVSEETIRRYLMRKPMTTTELLQKFKVKKTGLDTDRLVQAIALILKRLNPVKQVVKGKMYLSLTR